MNDAALTAMEVVLYRSVFRNHPEVTRVFLFGSRAKGTHSSRSDVDLALAGSVIPLQAQAIASELDELPLPYKFDVEALGGIQSPDLREHIQRVGVVLYPEVSPTFTQSTLSTIAKIENTFEALVHGRKVFWDLPKEVDADELRTLVILGLRETSGSYRKVAALFHIDANDYSRFMDFLRKNNSHIDSNPFRKLANPQI